MVNSGYYGKILLFRKYIHIWGYLMKSDYLFQAACVTAVAAAFVAQAPAAGAKFYDVTPGTEAEKAIHKLTALNITNGYTDGSFQPKKSVTRAEVAKMLALLDLDGAAVPKSTTSFVDVPANHWAANHIAYAKDHEWLTGYSDGSFRLDGVVTRGQFAKILKEYLGEGVPNVTLPFSDVTPGIWYEDGVKVLLAHGITTGTSATTFSPAEPITREQFAIFLDRAKLLDHAPAIPENTVKPEQPANASLAALANPNKVYDAVTLNKVLETMIPQQWIELTSLQYGAPYFNKSTGGFQNVVSGTYTYKYHDYLKPMELTPYILRITFNSTGVESFKVYTGQQFADVVNNVSVGPKQLAAYMNQIINNYNVVETGMKTSDGSGLDNARLTNDTWYFEHNEKTPKVVFVSYSIGGAHPQINQYYELTKESGDISGFSLKPMPIKQTFQYPAGYESAYIDITKLDYQGDRQYGLAYDITDKELHFYAINQYNDPIPVGTEMTIVYQDYEVTHSQEMHVEYVYNGQQFVQK